MELENKVALVLGAIKGIGKGIGLVLARNGARVALNYFDWEESLDDMRTAFEKTGRDHLVVRTNLLKTAKIQPLAANPSIPYLRC